MLVELVNRTLTPAISPMVYIMMMVSVFIGFFFATGFFASGMESIMYETGVLVHREAWGAVLFMTASTAEIGFITGKDRLVALGGVFGFMAWMFASISLALAGQWYIFISVALFHLLFHGYVVLASSLGYLRRAPVA